MSRIAYRSELDGLRAIAVLAVVVHHAGFGLRAGFVGVDVFFVISGYLITSLLYAEHRACGRISLTDFFARRIRRIFPALLLVVIFTVSAAVSLLSPYGEILDVTQSGAAALLFASNFHFQVQTGNYFSSNSERLPLLHLWSLGVEEQFYLAWSVGLAVLLRTRKFPPTTAIAVCAVSSILICEVYLRIDPVGAFYQMPTRFWEFAMGGLVALRPVDTSTLGRPLAGTGVFVLLLATAIPLESFPGIGALPPVIGASLLLCAVHNSSHLGWAGTLLSSQPMVFFGRISYSLYLWHWPLLALAKASRPGEIPLPIRITICAVSIAMAWLSYRFVEQPLRRPDPSTTPQRLVTASLFATAVLAYAVLVVGRFMNVAPPPTDLASRTARDWPASRFECHYQGVDDLSSFPRAACASPGNTRSRVAIWGDSHALAWEPFARIIAERSNRGFVQYTRDACAPVLGYDNGKHLLEANRCREFNELVFQQLRDTDLLVLAALWPRSVMSTDYAKKLEQTIARASARTARILVVGPAPYLRDSAPVCIRTRALQSCAISRQEFARQSRDSDKALRAISEKHRNVEFLNVADFFCSPKECPAVKDGYGLFWDSNHVSSTAARAFANQYLQDEAESRTSSSGRVGGSSSETLQPRLNGSQ